MGKNSPTVGPGDMGHKEELNRGVGVNDGAKHENESKAVC